MDEERVELESSLSEAHSSVESAKPTFDDALSYIDYVKEAFRDEPAKFNEFNKLLIALPNSVDEDIGIARIVELIKGHEHYESLLYRLGFFYPPALKFISPKESQDSAESKVTKRKLSAPDWENFINKLKIRFKTIDTHAVESFLKLMKMYEEQELSKKKMLEKVTDILHYHEDLIQDFSRILSSS